MVGSPQHSHLGGSPLTVETDLEGIPRWILGLRDKPPFYREPNLSPGDMTWWDPPELWLTLKTLRELKGERRENMK